MAIALMAIIGLVSGFITGVICCRNDYDEGWMDGQKDLVNHFNIMIEDIHKRLDSK